MKEDNKKNKTKKTQKQNTNNNKKNNGNNNTIIRKEEKKVQEIKKTKIEDKKEKKVLQEEKKQNDLAKEYNNYTIILSIVAGALLIFMAIVKIFGSTNQEYNESYLIKNNIGKQITCNEIKNVLKGKQSFIFVTELSEDEYKLEKKLASIISEKQMKNDFYIYIKDDSCGDMNNPLSQINVNLRLEEKLDKIPTILYYVDGSLVDIVKREDKAMINDGDFAKLLDIYQIN